MRREGGRGREGVREERKGEGVRRGSERGRGREGGRKGEGVRGEREREKKKRTLFTYFLSLYSDELALETVNLSVPCKRVRRREERRTGGRSEDEKGEEERGEEDRREE